MIDTTNQSRKELITQGIREFTREELLKPNAPRLDPKKYYEIQLEREKKKMEEEKGENKGKMDRAGPLY